MGLFALSPLVVVVVVVVMTRSLLQRIDLLKLLLRFALLVSPALALKHEALRHGLCHGTGL